MTTTGWTGDRERDDLIARELRYGQTRWTEIWLASAMALYGAVLLWSGDSFSLSSYRVIRAYVREDVAGAAAVAVGVMRLLALWYNGRRRRSPLVRVLGCAGGFLFYSAITVGFLASGPPLPTGVVYAVLAAAELHASSRSARDAVAYDSLGVRRRRREREQPAAGG